MKKILTILLIGLFLGIKVNAAETPQPNILKLNGMSDFWYVNPSNLKRFYISNAWESRNMINKVAIYITDAELQEIPLYDLKATSTSKLASVYAGRFVYSNVNLKEYWYIDPVRLQRQSAVGDGFALVSKSAKIISNDKLKTFERNANTRVKDKLSNYIRKTVKTRLGSFVTDIIEIDLANPNLKIVTDTADNYNCKKNCSARTLHSFVESNNVFAAMNGTYFDTSRAKLNYYFFPVFNSITKKFINDDQLKYPTTGPIMAFDVNNKFYYFKDSITFKSVANFEKKYGVKLQAAIGNKPRLVEDNLNYLIDWELDRKQMTVKSLRNAIAYKDNKVYLVVTQKSTVPDLAEVLINLGMQYGINIDGGYSTALFYDGKMVTGPGRNIPNAIMFGYKNIN